MYCRSPNFVLVLLTQFQHVTEDVGVVEYGTVPTSGAELLLALLDAQGRSRGHDVHH